HTGSQYGLHHVWTDALLADSRKDIEEARRLAKSGRAKEAVAMAEAGLRCAELFTQIHKSTFGFEFIAAEKAQEQLKAHVAMMAAKPEPHWAHERYAWGYYARFTGRTVDGGAKILKDGGQIVVRFPDVWKFRKDEKAVGVAQGWFKPGHSDADWQDFATVTKSWDDQGLGWYHGDAWYRVKFTMPAEEKTRAEARTTNGDLRLWFGGFDYNVDVYLNGHSLGEKRGFATPAEFSLHGIAQHLNFGGRNTLVVRVSSGDLAELGTGGLLKPVMIYRAGKQPQKPDKPGEKGPGYKM
ncbi:MAG TPA: beta galactosidase jelly roll domain-containing protein, partial [Phycisphaerae bacterium]|nr:beta galactosidase jelly roll domain-containing protein [Phycisphaerae bacterium]